MGGASGRTADLTQVRSTPPTCKRTPHRKDGERGGRVRRPSPGNREGGKEGGSSSIREECDPFPPGCDQEGRVLNPDQVLLLFSIDPSILCCQDLFFGFGTSYNQCIEDFDPSERAPVVGSRSTLRLSRTYLEVVMDKDNEQGTLESQLIQKNTKWKHEFECHQSQVEKLEEKLMEVKIDMKCAEEDTKDLELLWRRVKTTATMLTYLKSKARIMAIPHLACVSCGIKHQEGIGFVDKHGLPLSEWSTIVNLSSLESSDEMSQLASNLKYGPFDANDGAYFSETLKSTRVVAEVMESLIKRAIKAETEAATEKEKVKLGLEENKRKTLQIQGMTLKVEEMEKFALGTNTLLNEMRQKVTDMVEETSRQRQRAAENEQELRRVKQDFDSLSLSLICSMHRLVAETTHLENEKVKKEAEVQKLIEENVRLRTLLDKKEAQLLAMNEQCKWMALNSPGI
ncbi:hypothetical protein BHM03_00035170 [Ensete ventricosum]|nr:hypothetical protein BHM03_00035170 [Ensete ventricosum]